MSRDPTTTNSRTPASSPGPPELSAERWRRIVGLVEVALDLERPLRGAYLEAVTRKDPELRRQVHKMLKQFGMNGFVDVPSPEGSGAQSALDAERIGPYRLVKVLGRGGMGVVYLAERRDQDFERRVAVKIIGAGQEAPIVHQRFLSERQILARFDHPNIARLFEGGTTADGRPYFVLEYIEGLPLDAHCEEHHLTLEDRLRLFAEVCSAVSYAHQNLVVHRDLKPSNILVDREGKAKLLDFGIAKLLDPSAMPFELEATRTSLRPMTPSYAAPEQISGGRITTATDVFALGVLLYRLLTGRLPFELSGQLTTEEMLAKLAQDPPRPSQVLAAAAKDGLPPATWAGQDLQRIVRAVHGDLDNIVGKALRFEPDQRYAAVAKLAEDLRRFELGEPVTATRDTPLYSARKFIRKYRWGVAATAFLLLTLIAFSVASQRQAAATARERDKAEASARDARLTRDFLASLLDVADGISLKDNKVPLGTLLDRGLERLDQGQVADASARLELYQVLAKSYESLRDYRKAAHAWVAAAQLGETLERPPAELFELHQLASTNSLMATDFPGTIAQLEAARRHANSEQQEKIDLTLVDLESQLLHFEAFRERANSWLAKTENSELLGKGTIEILTCYLELVEVQGNPQRVIEIGPWLLAEITAHGNAAEFDEAASRAQASLVQAYRQLDQPQKAYQLFDELKPLLPLEAKARQHAGTLLRRTVEIDLQIELGQLERARQGIAEVLAELEKLSAVDPQDLRIRFLLGRIHLSRCEIARREGKSGQPEAEAALAMLAPAARELPTPRLQTLEFRALARCGRREEARLVMRQLLEAGYYRRDFLQLARELGLDAPAPPPALELALPAWLEQRIAAANAASARS